MLRSERAAAAALKMKINVKQKQSIPRGRRVSTEGIVAALFLDRQIYPKSWKRCLPIYSVLLYHAPLWQHKYQSTLSSSKQFTNFIDPYPNTLVYFPVGGGGTTAVLQSLEFCFCHCFCFWPLAFLFFHTMREIYAPTTALTNGIIRDVKYTLNGSGDCTYAY